MSICFLREGSDYLEDARRMPSLAAAKEEFRLAAEELIGYGQPHEATIHIAKTKEELVEYPDFVLSLGPRGGLRCESC